MRFELKNNTICLSIFFIIIRARISPFLPFSQIDYQVIKGNQAQIAETIDFTTF